MDILHDLWTWAKASPILAGGIAIWAVCTLVGRWQPSKAFVADYPRALPTVLIARDIGLAVSRIGQPLVALVSPKALRELMAAFYGPDETPVVPDVEPEATSQDLHPRNRGRG